MSHHFNRRCDGESPTRIQLLQINCDRSGLLMNGPMLRQNLVEFKEWAHLSSISKPETLDRMKIADWSTKIWQVFISCCILDWSSRQSFSLVTKSAGMDVVRHSRGAFPRHCRLIRRTIRRDSVGILSKFPLTIRIHGRKGSQDGIVCLYKRTL